MYKPCLFLSALLITSPTLAHRDNIDRILYEQPNGKNQTIVDSREKVLAYERAFKKRFPEASGFVVEALSTQNIQRKHSSHIEGGNWQLSINEADIIYTTNIKDTVCVIFSHTGDLNLAGLGCLTPLYYETRRGFHTSLMAKQDHPIIENMIHLFQNSLTQDQFKRIQVSVISNYFSDFYSSVCNYIKRFNLPLNFLSFPQIALKATPNFSIYYYDPTQDISLVSQLAIDPVTGKIFSAFEPTLEFNSDIINEGKIDILDIPTSIPTSILDSMGFKFSYDKKIVDCYRNLIATIFPEATELPLHDKFSINNNDKVIQLATGELSVTESNQILATSGILDCVVLVMTYDAPLHHKRIMYHHAWDRNSAHLKGTELDECLKKLNQELPFGYQKQTTVSLISYYLSNNVAQLGTFLKINGFKISHIYCNDMVIDEHYSIYLNPETVYREGNYNYRRSTGQWLQPRKIALNYLGQMTENWSWQLIHQTPQ